MGTLGKTPLPSGQLPSGDPSTKPEKRGIELYIKRAKEYGLALLAGIAIDKIIEHVSPNGIRWLKEQNNAFLAAVHHINAFGMLQLWYKNLGAEALKNPYNGGLGNLIADLFDTLQQMFSQGIWSLTVALLTLGLGFWGLYISSDNLKRVSLPAYVFGIPIFGSVLLWIVQLVMMAAGGVFGGVLAAAQTVVGLSFIVPISKAILDVHFHHFSEEILRSRK